MGIPSRIFAQASPLSLGGRSMFEVSCQELRSTSVSAFGSDSSIVVAATDALRKEGFEILQVTPLTINIAGPQEAYERAFGVSLAEKEVAQVNGTSSFIDVADGSEKFGLITTERSRLGSLIEGVALEVPRRFLSELPVPPPVDYWHLDVPVGVALAANALPLHSLGITGRGVRVAMVDSGWYRHAFFTANGYDVQSVVLGPAASAPEADESGHGTGESANILAIAPECTLLPVKANFANTVGAFNTAVALAPDIITCSWGSHIPVLEMMTAADQALAASIAAAVAAGITVIFSAGNGHAGFPGQHPEVISAGGTFMAADGVLLASNYSSGFQSTIFLGRNVPDVCGLVGMRPKAIYIMLPVEPGDQIDTGNAGGVFPDGDQTAPDDGWAAFSGTSAAAPQLAGVAALIKQAAPLAGPGDIKAAMMSTARDVAAGSCSPVNPLHNGLPAVPGFDNATGTGLVDASAAVYWAYQMVNSGFAGFSAASDKLDSEAWAPLVAAAATDPVAAAYLQGVMDAASAG